MTNERYDEGYDGALKEKKTMPKKSSKKELFESNKVVIYKMFVSFYQHQKKKEKQTDNSGQLGM